MSLTKGQELLSRSDQPKLTNKERNSLLILARFSLEELEDLEIRES